MDNLIASYLILNGECMLPGIGKLILQRSDAVCDVASKIILPPENKFELARTGFSDAGQLLTYISQSMGCDTEEASKHLTAWVGQVNNLLESGLEFTLPFVGVLKRERKGKTILSHAEKLSVYQPVPAVRVVHESDTHEVVVGDRISNSAEMNQYFAEEKSRGNSSFWPAALILFLIAVILIVLYFITDGYGFNLHPQSAPDTYILR